MTLCCATCVGKAANCIYPNKVVVDNAADTESAVAVDHVCATYTGNRRGNSNFIESDVIPMDIDNDHSDNPADWITEYKMEELFKPKETKVENIMTRKKRIFDLHQQRNGLVVFNPGDKLYRCVENSPDFFKLEGIVVGSTNQPHTKKTTKKSDDNFYETLDLKVKSLNPEKLWKSKVLRESIENDKNYVESLANWETNILNDGVPPKEKENKESKQS